MPIHIHARPRRSIVLRVVVRAPSRVESDRSATDDSSLRPCRDGWWSSDNARRITRQKHQPTSLPHQNEVDHGDYRRKNANQNERLRPMPIVWKVEKRIALGQTQVLYHGPYACTSLLAGQAVSRASALPLRRSGEMRKNSGLPSKRSRSLNNLATCGRLTPQAWAMSEAESLRNLTIAHRCILLPLTLR